MKITLHKGGTGEKTVELESIQIPDLWHIAQAQTNPDVRQKILTTWQLAHDLHKGLIGLSQVLTTKPNTSKK